MCKSMYHVEIKTNTASHNLVPKSPSVTDKKMSTQGLLGSCSGAVDCSDFCFFLIILGLLIHAASEVLTKHFSFLTLETEAVQTKRLLARIVTSDKLPLVATACLFPVISGLYKG